ncbi:hypothetical protein GQ457_12G013850 [Hibiscus cannabinus]
MRSFSSEFYKSDVSRCPHTNTETTEIQKKIKRQMFKMMKMMTTMTKLKDLDIQRNKDELRRSQAGMSNIHDSVFEQGDSSKPKSMPTITININETPANEKGQIVFQIPMAYIDLFRILVKEGIIAPIQSKQKHHLFPGLYDFKAQYEYHARVMGHSIEDCIACKR